MSGIANVSTKMKKKLSFGDYVVSAEPVIEAAPVATPPPETRSARKLYSLSKDDSHKLQEIFSKRLAQTPSSICEIMSEAIHRLHQHELS